MPPTAIISDIHANIRALRAVLAHAQAQQAARVICLGDIIGYGASPAECIDACHDFAQCLCGNHERAVLHDASDFNTEARRAVEWTRLQLEPGPLSPRAGKDRWRFIQNLPERHEEAGVLFVHGSPRNPVWEYLFDMDACDLLGNTAPKVTESLQLIEGLCFVGHTHVPGVITQDCKFMSTADLGGVYEYTQGAKAIVNVGSVGQPRDGDPRACYALWHDSTVTFHRVEYDAAAAAKDIEAANLPAILAQRLLKGF